MLSNFDYYKPDNLQDAVAYLDKNPDTIILAGGTDLMLDLRSNKLDVKNLLDIKGIPETNKLTYTPGEGLFIGASIPVNAISEDQEIRDKYPALVHATDALGSYQIRNRATLAGNIANASPGADTSAPLLVYEAKVHIASSEGTRVVTIEDFFTGLKQTTVKDNEIVIGVSIDDVKPEEKSIYLRKSRIKGHDLCNVGLALRLTEDKKVYIAIGAVQPVPVRLTELEESLASKELNEDLGPWIQEEIKKYISPRKGSVRSSAEYRYHIAGVLAKRGLLSLIDKGAN